MIGAIKKSLFVSRVYIFPTYIYISRKEKFRRLVETGDLMTQLMSDNKIDKNILFHRKRSWASGTRTYAHVYMCFHFARLPKKSSFRQLRNFRPVISLIQSWNLKSIRIQSSSLSKIFVFLFILLIKFIMQHLFHSIPRYSLSIFLKIDESSFFFFPFFTLLSQFQVIRRLFQPVLSLNLEMERNRNRPIRIK